MKNLLTLGDARAPMFWITAIVTLIYFTLIATRFIRGPEAAHIPPILGGVYLTLLSSYVSIKQVNKVQCKTNGGKSGKRPGELFFLAWIVLTIVMLVMTGFKIGGNGEV